MKDLDWLAINVPEWDAEINDESNGFEIGEYAYGKPYYGLISKYGESWIFYRDFGPNVSFDDGIAKYTRNQLCNARTELGLRWD